MTRDELIKAMAKNKISAAAIAKELSVNKSTVHRWLSGEVKISTVTAFAIKYLLMKRAVNKQNIFYGGKRTRGQSINV